MTVADAFLENKPDKQISSNDKDVFLVKPLVFYVEPLPQDELVIEVADAFYRSPEIDAFPLASETEIVGMITRKVLSHSLFSKFGQALYGKKKIGRLALEHPVVINENSFIDNALILALERQGDTVYDNLMVKDENGNYVGMVSVRDLIEQQGVALAHTISGKEIISEKNRELEKISKMKSSFLSNVTHELRAPVNTMIGLGELMYVACETDNVAKVKGYASKLLNSATNLRALVNNILDLTKMEAGRMKIMSEEFDIAETVKYVAEATEVLVRDKEVQIKTEIPEIPVMITSDPVKVRQILTNLANNAAKFTDKGEIVLSLKQLEESVELKVSDTGVGIRKEDQEQLFTAFIQVQNAKTKSHDGSGLGLTITRQLICLLNGTIEMESRFGDGTTMTVTIPYNNKQME